MVYIASDHGGFQLKNELIKFLEQEKVPYEDLGPTELVPDDDYTDYILKLVERVRSDEQGEGIILCRNGVGVSMLANKFKGIRAALSFNPKHAASTRNDDHANVLALPADYIDTPTAIEIVKTWLGTPFSDAERFTRRLGKEEQYGQE